MSYISRAQLNINQKVSKKRKIHGTKEVMFHTTDGETIIVRLVLTLILMRA